MIKKLAGTLSIIVCLILWGCREQVPAEAPVFTSLSVSENILNYSFTPTSKFDKNGLMFSDQGAWFAYSFPDSIGIAGFTGPFLMTQQNGIWSSRCLSYLRIKNINWKAHKTRSTSGFLEQVFISDDLQLTQRLAFKSGHTALIYSEIENTSDKDVSIQYQWRNAPILADGLELSGHNRQIEIASDHTDAMGYIQFSDSIVSCENNSYETQLKTASLAKGEVIKLDISQTFIFPEYDWGKEQKETVGINFDSLLERRKREKDLQLSKLLHNRRLKFQDSFYAQALAKAHLTLQNNWRIPAGEIKFEGLFPSYHYEWFNGFWSWDSWKHSVGLSFYDITLAKKQIKLMFEFQDEDGFVADCVYRDTTIEAHNYRDTKPPLSAWAVAAVFEKSLDTAFVHYMYPKLKKYHQWWYQKRDHDQDGLCEYGSTDGSLVAAKWESGMDNAIRFDGSRILKNSDDAYSLDQESVDLNCYLYAEKLLLADLAMVLAERKDSIKYKTEADFLKGQIQRQFYDEEKGWFYDTSLDGEHFIRGEGSEGWTALWTMAATQEQAEAVKEIMMDTTKFFTRVPFQTMSADHERFDPLKGYWRGPNWLDQAYFGVKGLRNYGYNDEANKATKQILEGANGLLEKGPAIRENYHPLTGEGLHAYNFSWSAAHVIMLLMKEQ
ncbi:MAG: trehalase family glycosidase [Ekhidna sp.]